MAQVHCDPQFWLQVRLGKVRLVQVRLKIQITCHFCPFAGNFWPFPPVDSYFWPPPVISDPPRPIPSIFGHLWPISAISGHPRQIPVISGNPRLIPVISGHLQIFPANCSQSRSFPAIFSHFQPFPTIPGQLQSFRAIFGYFSTFPAIHGQSRSFPVILGYNWHIFVTLIHPKLKSRLIIRSAYNFGPNNQKIRSHWGKVYFSYYLDRNCGRSLSSKNQKNSAHTKKFAFSKSVYKGDQKYHVYVV